MHAAAHLRDNHVKPAMVPSSSLKQTSLVFSSPERLDTIFEILRQQIDQWGRGAKWKINLVLQSHEVSDSPVPQPDSTMRNAKRTLSATTPYPWGYVAPSAHESFSNPFTEDITQKLRDVNEKQKQLETMLRSRSGKTQRLQGIDRNSESINHMRLILENEKNIQYLVEIEMLRKDIKALALKLKRQNLTLHAVENIKVPPEDEMLDKDALIGDRRLLLRKLHLAELRLAARDAELGYLQDSLRAYSTRTHEDPQITRHPPTPQMALHKDSPYLFQQRYSPKIRGEIIPSQYMSGLESLGILADQMLSNPDFEKNSQESQTQTEKHPFSPALGEQQYIHTSPPPLSDQDDTPARNFDTVETPYDMRRSKRSIDLANALLSMPIAVHSPRRENTGSHVNKPEMTHTLEMQTDGTLTRKRNQSMLATDEHEYFHEVQGVHGEASRGRAAANAQRPWRQSLFFKELDDEFLATTKPRYADARQSPSIAALLNSSEDAMPINEEHKADLRTPLPHITPAPDHGSGNHGLPPYQGYHSHVPQTTPTGYSPPSPISTPTKRNHSSLFNRPM